MPAIATIGAEVRVTPDDLVQVVRGPGNHEFIDDRSPFSVRVTGIMEDSGAVIGVYGDVTAGHQRYLGQIATLLVRLDFSDWRRDNTSQANFKVGRSVAQPNGRHPFHHPEGTDIEGFPFIMRFGSIDSRRSGEPQANSALETFRERGAEPFAAPNGGPAIRSDNSGAGGGPPSVS